MFCKHLHSSNSSSSGNSGKTLNVVTASTVIHVSRQKTNKLKKIINFYESKLDSSLESGDDSSLE
jgi:hypothetical protein